MHGLAIIKRLLQRQQTTHGRLDAELVLVRVDPFIAEAEGVVSAAEQDWTVRQARGPLSLRAALLDPGPHVVVLGPGIERVPLDLAHRAWLRKPLVIEGRDVIAALTERSCVPLPADALDRMRGRLDVIARRAKGWLWRGNHAVQLADAEALLAESAPITCRYADELLAEWLRDPQGDHAAQIASLGRFDADEQRWLARAATPEGLDAIITAGALAPVPRLAGLVDPALVDRTGNLGRLVSGALARIGARPDHPLLRRARQMVAAVTLLEEERGVLRLLFEAAPDDDADAPRGPTLVADAPAWLRAIEPPFRNVFAHVAEHGGISEPELHALLGTARRARRFANRWAEFEAPFTLVVDETSGIKRYVRKELDS